MGFFKGGCMVLTRHLAAVLLALLAAAVLLVAVAAVFPYAYAG